MQTSNIDLPTFGTDGVRGLANKVFTPSAVSSLALVFSKILDANHTTPIILARDTRISGDSISSAFKASVTSYGIDVIDLGVCSTPAAIYVMRTTGYLGAVISASHNPYYDNGIKLFDRGGVKLSKQQEEEIEQLWHKHLLDNNVTTWFDKNDETEFLFGKISDGELALQGYIQNLTEKFSDTSLKNLKVVLDCANGATSLYAHIPFQKLGAEVEVINNQPDGTNINKDCGATNTSQLQDYIQQHNADIGFAFDGDADRVIAVDKNGQIRNGDDILYTLTTLTNQNNAVLTVMSNGGVIEALNQNNIDSVITNVGDKNVLAECEYKNIRFGAEQSGHIIDMDYMPTGDGLYIALLICSILKSNDTSIDEVCKNIKLHVQKQVNVKVDNSKHQTVMSDTNVLSALQESQKFARILVRPSGTEPYIRILVESSNEELASKLSKDLKELIEKV